MNKQTLILITIALVALMGLGLVNAAVYSTPGFVAESKGISSEVFITTNIQEDLTNETLTNETLTNETLTNETFPAWIVFIVFITIVAACVQIKFLLKKRRIKKKKGLTPNLVKDALKNMDKVKDISKTPEEFNELVSELGLEEVMDKIKEGNNNEQKK